MQFYRLTGQHAIKESMKYQQEAAIAASCQPRSDEKHILPKSKRPFDIRVGFPFGQHTVSMWICNKKIRCWVKHDKFSDRRPGKWCYVRYLELWVTRDELSDRGGNGVT